MENRGEGPQNTFLPGSRVIEADGLQPVPRAGTVQRTIRMGRQRLVEVEMDDGFVQTFAPEDLKPEGWTEDTQAN